MLEKVVSPTKVESSLTVRSSLIVALSPMRVEPLMVPERAELKINAIGAKDLKEETLRHSYIPIF